LFCLPLYSQERDSLYTYSDTLIITGDFEEVDSLFLAQHSPRKAGMYSAVFPGMGQIYNRKYWKLPIVYAGFGGLIYGILYNADGYIENRDLFKYMKDNQLSQYEGITFKQAEVYKDFHKRYRDLFIIVTAGFYGLQIIDAIVDAHLIDYDVSDDLTFTVDPDWQSSPAGIQSFGLRCCLSF
jgi:hypothetical protein